MEIFKGHLLIFLIISVRDSSCVIDGLHDIGGEVWNFYSVFNKMNSFGFSNPTTVRQLFGNDHLLNEGIARRMLRIHNKTEAIETSINEKIFGPVFGILTSNAMIYRCLDQMKIFVGSINDDYKIFYETVIGHGYLLDHELRGLPTSVFRNIDSNIQMIRKIMIAPEELLPDDKNLVTAITNYTVYRKEWLCGDIAPMAEILIQLFRTVIVAEIKYSLMFSFASIYQHTKNQEWKIATNFAKMEFRKYFQSYVTTLNESLVAIEDVNVRACDPYKSKWTLDENVYELTGTAQAVIFEYDWKKCFVSCEDMWQENRDKCEAGFHDERSGCAYEPSQCRNFYGVEACVLKNGPRKFQYVRSELGFFGKNSECPKNDGYIIDNMRSENYTCTCNCNGNHYEISVSVMEGRNGTNEVITGLRFFRKKNILYIQPSVAKLGENGYIQPDSERWLRIRSDPGAIHFRTAKIQKGIFFLEDLQLPPGFVLTGVKFAEVIRESIVGFTIQIFGLPFNYKSGRLDYNGELFVSNIRSNAGSPLEFGERNSLSINVRNTPSLGDEMYVQLKHSLLEDDFGQSTLPLFDAIPIKTNPPSALGGIGIFHKSIYGYAGFIALRVYGIIYSEYFRNFTAAHTIDGRLQVFI